MSPLPRRWSCAPYDLAAADRMRRALGLSPVAAAVLARRGLLTEATARAFLAADERHDPTGLGDVEEACELILGHVARGSRIVVHGDFDVDGVCATAVAVRALRALGADAHWHLPSRFEEGHGLSAATVDRLAGAGTGLLVTVDCGITAAEEVGRARAAGLDVVVTDHHLARERLPACPLVHPGLGSYPFPDLCGTAVAHKLAEALLVRAGADRERVDEDLDLVGLATVADVVPLRGENRRLVREGMRALQRTRKPGLRELMRVAAVEPGAMDAHAAGFRLGPRLNAAGRLGRADAALELILTDDPDRAAAVADELDLLNRERRDTETRMLFAAEAARAGQEDAPVLVLAGAGWHPGVIGIVAARMVERHHRPCVLVALGRDGGRGSGRSIDAYDLHAGLAASATHLRRFGGHAMAAGFDIDPGEVDAFRETLVDHAGSTLRPHDLVPVEPVDAVVPGGALGLELAEELERLGPFGHGNPAPTLLLPGARVSAAVTMGEDRQHCRFSVSSGAASASAVAFRTTAAALAAVGPEPVDVAVGLERNEWNGTVEPRLVLRALCPSQRGRCRILDEERVAAVERELTVDPSLWTTFAGPSSRLVSDRRGQGFAGVAGDLITAGARPLVVCADPARRVEGLERLVAGLAGLREPGASLEVIAWDRLAAAPGLAEPFDHVVALDPPPCAAGERLLESLPASGAPAFAHLAWGPADADFALAVAEAQLELRRPLTELYRELRAAGEPAGRALEDLLAGAGRPRAAPVCGRLVRILVELGLVRWEALPGAGARCSVLDAPRTSLERSAAHRAYHERLREARRYLGAAGAQAPASPRTQVPASPRTGRGNTLAAAEGIVAGAQMFA